MPNRAAAVALVVLALAGMAGVWAWLPAWLLAGALLWLPGRVLAATVVERELVRASAPLGQGPGRVALSFVLSVFLAAVAMAPCWWLGSSLAALRWSLALTWLAVAAAAWRRPAARDPWVPSSPQTARRLWIVWALATAALAPPIVAFAGGTVDDWWDLAFVRAWIDHGLSAAEPMLATGAPHPRFGWNVWLLLQAVLAEATGQPPWLLQARVLAPLLAAMLVSATAALAAAVFHERDRRVAWSMVAVVPWLWGTEALPLATRIHQDKFVAGFVMLPMVLALALRALRRRRPAVEHALVAAALVALVSVHELVAAIAVAGLLVLVTAEARPWRDGLATLVAPQRLAVAVLGPALLAPGLVRAWRLSERFAAQGISWSTPDNPVVRAHLWLDRLAWSDTPWYFVRPDALFGPVALPALLGLVVLWRLRHRDGARALAAWTWLPALVVFVPGLAGLVGKVWIPWMLYRIGWLIPLPLLLACAASIVPRRGADGNARRGSRVAPVLVATLVGALCLPTAAVRWSRHMAPRGASADRFPYGDAREVLDFLAAAPDPGAVLAPAGLAGFVPAMSGRPVVALSERGTLVFSPEEFAAYRRLADNRQVLASSTDPAERVRIAAARGVAYVVRPRRAGPPAAIWERATTEAWVALDSGRASGRVAEEEAAWAPPQWTRVLANGSWSVWRTGAGAAPGAARAGEEKPGPGQGWAGALGAQLDSSPVPPARLPHPEGLLMSAAGWPGGRLWLDPPPLTLSVPAPLVWTPVAEDWAPVPDEVRIVADLGGFCHPLAVELLPQFRAERRDVWEISAGAAAVRRHARDGVPLRVELDGRRRRLVEVRIASVLGLAPALADLRVYGDADQCAPGRGVLERSEFTGLGVDLPALLGVSWRHPNDARPRVRSARWLADHGREAEARALLERAVEADPGDAAAWVELGLAADARAVAMEPGPEREDLFEEALAAYERAVAADPDSAWARGALAWACYRAGAPARMGWQAWRAGGLLRAGWHAWRATTLDPRYSDAWTIWAYVLHAAGARSSAMAALDHARALSPVRSWPRLARAEFLVREGRRGEARAVLADYLARMPGDADVEARLAQLGPEP